MKKIVILLVSFILIVLVIGIAYLGWTISDTARTHITEIDLTKITTEEISEIKRLNFLELEKYPSSLEFISLREESEIRETQFIIKFSVREAEKENYNLEKNTNESPNTITILEVSNDNEKVIYEMHTNFAQNSKDDKWSYLYKLIDKYDNQ